MFDRIVLNIPHSSSLFPYGKECWDKGLHEKIVRWTDWFTDELFIANIPGVFPVVYPYSRFFCDVERLLNDPLETIGQGIVYKEFEGLRRNLNTLDTDAIMDTYYAHIFKLRESIKENTLLIDCHSFPSDLSMIEVCIGFNDDWSRPDNSIIEQTVSHFEGAGYIVGINKPYSNSISPECSTVYSSMMIEVNKKVYLTRDLACNLAKTRYLAHTIQSLYSALLIA